MQRPRTIEKLHGLSGMPSKEIAIIAIFNMVVLTAALQSTMMTPVGLSFLIVETILRLRASSEELLLHDSSELSC